MFERALTNLETNKTRMVRLGARVKPPYDQDTIEGQIWRQPYVCPNPFKASPHVCDIIVSSGLAEYGDTENTKNHRKVQGVRYTGLEGIKALRKTYLMPRGRHPKRNCLKRPKLF